MKPTQTLTLIDVKCIAAAAEAEAIAHGWAVSIAVCDAGGHALYVKGLHVAVPLAGEPAGKAGLAVVALLKLAEHCG